MFPRGLMIYIMLLIRVHMRPSPMRKAGGANQQVQRPHVSQLLACPLPLALVETLARARDYGKI